MRIATFNVQNLRLRFRDGVPRLEGARDDDVPEDLGPEAIALDPIDRRLTAGVLKDADADVVGLQEVFDKAALDQFHDTLLVPSGLRPYPYRVCLPGNDGRGLEVAVMSRLQLDSVTSHAAETPCSLGLDRPASMGPRDRIFRRDCLEVSVGRLTVFICHFKAPYPDPAAAWPIRRLEAAAVRRLIERRYETPVNALWLVLGDLNEPADLGGESERAIAPLLDGFAVDLLLRLPPPERWSYHQPQSALYSRPDALLASPALAARWCEARPEILRAGLDLNAQRYEGPRLDGVGTHRPHASDHAALAISLPGL
jgi:endonuclease/exonuclease/phosphatase family metal-dependent hydrolase